MKETSVTISTLNVCSYSADYDQFALCAIEGSTWPHFKTCWSTLLQCFNFDCLERFSWFWSVWSLYPRGQHMTQLQNWLKCPLAPIQLSSIMMTKMIMIRVMGHPVMPQVNLRDNLQRENRSVTEDDGDLPWDACLENSAPNLCCKQFFDSLKQFLR